jgi:hypothetical protein
VWITWNHQDTDFSKPWTIEDKTEIFYERIYGWQLHVADLMVNGGLLLGTDQRIQAIPHSGFACLQVCLSYFETIAKYREGFAREGHSREYFKKGFLMVFPKLNQADRAILNLLLDSLYEGARCGLYHASMASPGIGLGQCSGPIGLSDNNDIVINPNNLPIFLKQYLNNYRDQLRDSQNLELRANFEKRFDCDYSVSKHP